MLGSVGRIALFLLVFLVAALAVRVLFVDARSPDEIELSTKTPKVPLAIQPRTQLPARPAPEPLPLAPDAQPAPPVHVIDSDPDLDQSSEPADCQGGADTPPENEPAPPVPH
jgi:hypothetical protein